MVHLTEGLGNVSTVSLGHRSKLHKYITNSKAPKQGFLIYIIL